MLRYESYFTIKLLGSEGGGSSGYWLDYCIELLFSRHINYIGKTLLAKVRASNIRNNSKSYDSSIPYNILTTTTFTLSINL